MAPQFTHPLQVLREHGTALEAALSVCLADPGQKAVHRLRTETRRVEAQLLLLARLRSLPEHHEAGQTLRRELRHLRRAAGTVRDLDVHRKYLEALSVALPAEQDPAPNPAQSPAPNPAPSPAEEKTLLQGSTDLRAHLGHKRDRAARALQRLLAQRQTKAALAIEALLKRLLDAVDVGLSAGDLLRHAEAVFHRDGLLRHGNLSKLGQKELHAIRKSAKAARYLAETLPGNALAKAAAQRFEAIQEAGGQWHDAVELTQAARKHLGKIHPLSARFTAGRDRDRTAYLLLLRGQLLQSQLLQGQMKARTKDRGSNHKARTKRPVPAAGRPQSPSGVAEPRPRRRAGETPKFSK